MLTEVFREDGPFSVPRRMTSNSKDSDINGRAMRATGGGMVARAASRA